jgi:hypothetical protein
LRTDRRGAGVGVELSDNGLERTPVPVVQRTSGALEASCRLVERKRLQRAPFEHFVLGAWQVVQRPLEIQEPDVDAFVGDACLDRRCSCKMKAFEEVTEAFKQSLYLSQGVVGTSARKIFRFASLVCAVALTQPFELA